MTQIKKGSLEVFFNLTKGTEGALNLAESRIRDTFIKSLSEVTQTYIDDRNKIYVAFCIKNEDGQPDLVDGDKYKFPKEKRDELAQELETLFEEKVELDTPVGLKEILEKSEYKPKLLEAEVIDNIINLL